jgi:hypothetical protein
MERKVVMNCENVREEIVERLVRGDRPSSVANAEHARAVEEHLASCDGCRAEADRLRALWGELGALSAPAAPVRTGAEARVARLVDARGSRGARGSVRHLTPLLLSLAAMLLVGLALGRWLGVPRNGPTASPRGTVAVTPSADARAQFILLLQGPAAAADAPAPSADEVRALVAEYGQWAQRLRQAGTLVSAEKLSDEPFQVLSRDGARQPPRGAADELGGFFVIRAADADEAHRIARQSPHLKYGGTIQVRRIEPT